MQKGLFGPEASPEKKDALIISAHKKGQLSKEQLAFNKLTRRIGKL